MIFASSSISAALLCSRPAVSISSTSAPSARALLNASNASPAASALRGPEITGAPVRSPHTCNCSTAAARKVSPATNTARSPSSRYCIASLPIVVVFPVPFTPTTRITCGLRLRSSTSGLATGARIVAISSASDSLISASVTLRPNLLLRNDSTMSAAAAGPRSAPSSNSSNSANASSSRVRLLNAAVSPPVSFSVERVSPALSLLKNPPSATTPPPPAGRRRRHR